MGRRYRAGIRLAFRTADQSVCGTPHGAVVLHGRRVVARARNRYTGHGTIHAEVAALRRAGVLAYGSTVVSVRASGAQTSRPCAACWRALVLAGVRTVVYYDGVRWTVERV